MGPARSPRVLLTPSPFSAKVEAHWLTESSLAPAQTIINISSQNCRILKSSLTFSPLSPSWISGAMGTLANRRPLAMGTAAHTNARIHQFPMPNNQKNRVDISTTPTCPQQ